MTRKSVTEPSIPFPKAKLSRLVISAGAALLVLGVVWIVWSRLASRRLQARVDGIVARHEPFYPQDFAAAAVPKGENAAAYLQAATGAMSRTVWPPSGSMLSYKNYPPFPPEWRQMAEQAVAANGPALRLARQSRPFGRADWGVTSAAFFNSLNTNRALAHALADGALLAHFQGDDAEAIERVRDVLHQAEVIDAGPGGDVGHLISVGFDALAEDRLEVMAPGLNIADDGPPATPATIPASRVSRTVLRGMIADLLDDSHLRERRRHAVLVTRSDLYAYYRGVRAGATLLRPMLDLETERILTHETFRLRAVEQSSFAASAHEMPQPPLQGPVAGGWSWNKPKDPRPPRYAHVLSSELERPNLYLMVEWQWVAERRVAAADLAIQLYRTDHHDWPPTLDALVPAYLPAVPADPFGTANQPLRYVVLRGASPGPVERPLIYFRVPPDGRPGAPPAEPSYGASGVRTQWRDVSRWSPALQTAPATQP